MREIRPSGSVEGVVGDRDSSSNSSLFRHLGPLEVTGNPAGTSANFESKHPLHQLNQGPV